MSEDSNTSGGAANGQTIAWRIPDHVVYRAFPAETVLLNLDTGRYHGLNPTAGRMLEVLGAEGDAGRAVAKLAEEFDVATERVAADLRVFCEDLSERGLLERHVVASS